MIRLFYGDDRLAAEKKIRQILGEKYEVIEGESLVEADLPSVFLGMSLFSEQRKILIKDVSKNEGVFLKLPEYVGTEHEVVIWEMKIGKQTKAYKEVLATLEVQEFREKEKVDRWAVFEIYKLAKRDGRKAVEKLEEIETEQDPFLFLGVLVSQVIKDYSLRQGVKEKRALIELSLIDVQMKTTSIQPWSLLKSFLLRVSTW